MRDWKGSATVATGVTKAAMAGDGAAQGDPRSTTIPAAVAAGVEASDVEAATSRSRAAAVAPLRLMAVHAHPDDESSKGAASLAKYAAEGAGVVVVSCTGG